MKKFGHVAALVTCLCVGLVVCPGDLKVADASSGIDEQQNMPSESARPLFNIIGLGRSLAGDSDMEGTPTSYVAGMVQSGALR